jgi:hypothetical protein
MDRRNAEGNLKAGLLAAALAIGVFGLTWFAAILYIG